MLMLNKDCRGSSTELRMGRQAVIKVKFIVHANPTISLAAMLFSFGCPHPLLE